MTPRKAVQSQQTNKTIQLLISQVLGPYPKLALVVVPLQVSFQKRHRAGARLVKNIKLYEKGLQSDSHYTPSTIIGIRHIFTTITRTAAHIGLDIVKTSTKTQKPLTLLAHQSESLRARHITQHECFSVGDKVLWRQYLDFRRLLVVAVVAALVAQCFGCVAFAGAVAAAGGAVVVEPLRFVVVLGGTGSAWSWFMSS